MTEIVERVVSAIIEEVARQEGYIATYPSGDDETTKTTIDGRFDMEAIVRAAIKAMREPTEAMMDRTWQDQVADSGEPELIWQTMIDEILK